MYRSKVAIQFAAILAGLLTFQFSLPASDDMLIYSDRLNNGWGDWGWVPHYATNNPVHSGSNSMVFAASSSYQAWWLKHDNIDTTIYSNLTLWVNGGTNGGQYIGVQAELGGSTAGLPRLSGTAPVNSWTMLTFSLASLGVANVTNLTGLQIWNGGTLQSNFYLDDITLVAAPPPAVVHVSVNVKNPVRTVDSRLFSVNTAAWDGSLDSTSTLSVLNDMNNQALRWPGGSWADDYHFTNEYAAYLARGYGCVTTNFMHIATNTHAQVYFIANYGSSGTNEAVDWVNFCNATNHWGVKYWEIGNEIFGSWEEDYNTNATYFGTNVAHDPWTYAMRFKDYYKAMKAVDPTIKIGAIAVPDEVSYANNTNHPAINPVTGTTNNGWTAVMLNTMRTNGVTPDFLIEHKYAPGDGDTYNLLWTRTWAGDAVGLRQILNDYLGTSVATNIELVDTEYGPEGDKQWISLVGGLFYADSVGQIMQTEFNSLLWWDLRNGQAAVTNSDNALYGWRTNSYGFYLTDEGCVTGNAVPPNRYPSFYCMKLMQYFARGGDTVVQVTNDYELLGTYAVQRTNGTLTLLVINKSSTYNLTAAVNVSGYLPATNTAVYSYGIPQDDAARTGLGSPDILQTNFTGAGVNFTNTFAPYSATVLVFNQAPPPMLAVQPAVAGKFIFQLQGQSGASYILQSSTDLTGGWTSVATNTLSAAMQNFTNTISASQQFWRAVWQP